MKRFGAWLLMIALVNVWVTPAIAQELQLPEYTGSEFQELYEYAVSNTLPNLETPDERYAITGNDELDDRIWTRALERGYVLRPTAAGDLGNADGVTMQAEAADAWVGLKSEARDAGMRFVVSSAYRSPASQRTQFRSKLSGSSDEAIDAALTWYSVPGTSKHHSGYALDFRYRDGTFGDFRSTPDYAWLQQSNFDIPKSFGLIPSYPDDGRDQGPNPEPWEFVWVGVDMVRCGIPQDLAKPEGPTAAIVADIEHCPGGMGAVAGPDWLDVT